MNTNRKNEPIKSKFSVGKGTPSGKVPHLQVLALKCPYLLRDSQQFRAFLHQVTNSLRLSAGFKFQWPKIQIKFKNIKNDAVKSNCL